ncbi:MAG: glycoside hydrolase [Planctomycetes bacterium]|nr:glycoside hydrolase [Planctomycetota bacterium]
MNRFLSPIVTLLFAAGAAGCVSLHLEPLSHVDVFSSGEDGYNTYRIPVIETAPDGTLLVFTEARKYSSHDPGLQGNDIDLVSKHSHDGGKTWSEMRVIDDPGERWSACNPATLVDRDTGYVWLFHARTKPDRSSSTSRPGTDDSQAWARYSTDNGRTWSEPQDMTKVTRDFERWGSAFFGPGGAIQSSSGRLIVPLATTTGVTEAQGSVSGGGWTAFVIYSDDHGKTWQRGELVPSPRTSENQVIELADGTLLMDARQKSGIPNRWFVTSTDGGATWTEPKAGQTVPPIAAAIERYSRQSAGDERDRIVWTGPKGPGRQTLVLRASYDEGKTFVNERVISSDKAAYSDLTVLDDKSVGVIWERGGYAYITYSRFTLDFLEP